MCGDDARATTLMAKMPSSTSAALAARKNGSSRNTAGGQLNPALKRCTKPLSFKLIISPKKTVKRQLVIQHPEQPLKTLNIQCHVISYSTNLVTYEFRHFSCRS